MPSTSSTATTAWPARWRCWSAWRISHVSLQLGDRQLAAMMVCLVGATVGFLVWNYPRGKIFAGDGGAYV